ncbi:Hypothetical predicted protein [Cloeon dipterum]|uniref:Uncharacterized protein n=1 Tax=Cloeon dipterum TaxID=197152 RepID=A0A8S1DIA5_9INSE|nr:Hypothetical predicted protein [Cloeon dipterum]
MPYSRTENTREIQNLKKNQLATLVPIIGSATKTRGCFRCARYSNFSILIKFKMSQKDNDIIYKRKPFSLQEMTFDTIVKNIGRYKELLKTKISPPWRERLGEEMMKRKWEIGTEQIWTAFPYLETHKTIEYFSTSKEKWLLKSEVKRGKSAEPEFGVSINEILQYLDKFAPNLKKLCIEDTRGWYEINKYKKLRLDKCATDLICQMRNLTHIWIKSVNVKFSVFESICRENKILQEIEADRILVDVDLKSMKMTLENFASAFDHQEYTNWNFPLKIGIVFKKTDAVEHCRRANHIVGCAYPDTVFFGSIPEITHLEISIKPTRCNMVELQPILNKVGGNLKELRLLNWDRLLKFTFQIIFEHCENLESLVLEGHVEDDDKPINSFGKLKELHMFLGDFNLTLPLKSILSAPLLQDIHITAYNFDMGDKEGLFNRIRNREICTKVRKFIIETMALYDSDMADLEKLLHEIEKNSPEPIFTKLKAWRWFPAGYLDYC